MESINPKGNKKVSLTLDYRLIVAVLVLIIAGMVALWRPWEAKGDRTIEVNGQATVTAVPDEFVFYPVYEFTNSNPKAALDALVAKSNEVSTKLKEIGVPENSIKVNSDSYSYPLYKEDGKTPTYALRFTVTLAAKELAQKVQDYLLSTSPSGTVSPQAAFSDKKRQELENSARDQATKDARAKAEQSAKSLGFSLGAVKSVTDGAGFGYSMPVRGMVAQDSVAPEQSLPIQPGENELTYSVSVVYFVR